MRIGEIIEVGDREMPAVPLPHSTPETEIEIEEKPDEEELEHVHPTRHPDHRPR
jgi:hypothetical protein